VLGLAAAAPVAAAGLCDPPRQWSATEQDRLLRVAAAARAELERSGRRVALVSRAGLDLARFDQVYSHAGLSLKSHPEGAWTVRQLYFACDEGQPRLFDQGLAGFVFGTDDPRRGHLSIVTLPPEADPQADAEVEDWVLDNRRALALQGGTYSANAYPFRATYQNCNQWVVEVLAAAWGGADPAADVRAQAQAWLRAQAFAPTTIALTAPWWRLAALFVPWVHTDDHPAEDLAHDRVRISMPPSIEAFVRQRWPGAARVELCHDERHLVVRRGWTPLGSGCEPSADDVVTRWR
jgi:hypothetical protein